MRPEWTLLIPILYAEMHHTLGGFSLVFRDLPEIVSDIPSRVEPESPVPVLLIIKDADRFPVDMLEVLIQCRYAGGGIRRFHVPDLPEKINDPFWSHVFSFPVRSGYSGRMDIRTAFKIRRHKDGRVFRFTMDNYRGIRHRPFQVHVAGAPYPRFKSWYLGDLHYHSSLTSDQVEFGAPLSETAEMARASGLHFIGITDHSYDLDDDETDYLKKDPHLIKWKRLIREAQRVENQKHIIMIPGEEVSAGSAGRRNVHLLVLNNREFFHGSGDGAEKWFETEPELQITDILESMDDSALAYAAHPEDRFNFLHRLLLRRGKWTVRDYRHGRLNGLQILNGVPDRSFRRGLRQWIRLLLSGRKLSIVAGNDAHGNFNRFRQLGLPFLFFVNRDAYIFGRFRTGVHINGALRRSRLIESLARGHTYVTSGPALSMTLINDSGEKALHGDTIRGRLFTLHMECGSTDEFGRLHCLKIWLGDTENHQEHLLHSIRRFSGLHSHIQTINVSGLPARGYLRGELIVKKKKRRNFCLTNPVWFHRSEDSLPRSKGCSQ